jgi:hypothetical protein
MKGVGRVYQQTVIDTYSKVAFAKLYDRKTPLAAADLMNDRVARPAASATGQQKQALTLPRRTRSVRPPRRQPRRDRGRSSPAPR